VRKLAIARILHDQNPCSSIGSSGKNELARSLLRIAVRGKLRTKSKIKLSESIPKL
jgi:hypothetical protein